MFGLKHINEVIKKTLDQKIEDVHLPNMDQIIRNAKAKLEEQYKMKA